jgi:membrane-associated protease RseP (regulator of RpoE activity)
LDGFDDRPWRPEPPAGPEPPRRPVIELLPPGYAPALPAPLSRPRWRLSLFLFVLTFLCATTMSPPMYLATRTDATMWPDYGGDRIVTLSPTVIARVWGDPYLLHVGLTFAFAAMTILLAHEMGHYVACRYYRLPCTPPYFLPVPINFGTFGAFIRIKAPIRSKRELFDVGVAGPIAGFVALVPFLLYGIAHSEPVPLPAAPPGSAYGLLVFGRCLAIELAVRLFHGPLAPGTYLNLHPAALGAWLGLLATAINLLPLGQLDGGHILYAATGRLQRRLALPLWILLALLGLHWPGWLLWCVIVLLLGLRHPPVRDELTPLDPGRRWLALLALVLQVLSFMPVPIDLQAVLG